MQVVPEVVIPLKKLRKDEPVGSPEDYMKVIQAEYAGKYLEALGIAATPANRAAVMRFRPMDDCGIQGIWDPGVSSATASAIKVVPPGKGQPVKEDFSDLNDAWVHNWYGQGHSIAVSPPTRPSVWQQTKAGKSDDDRSSRGGATTGTPVKATTPVLGTPRVPGFASSGAEELKAEFERAAQARRDQVKRAEQQSWEAGLDAKDAAAVRARHDLAMLKARFLLPFACERSARGRSSKEICLWPAEGELDVEVVVDPRSEAAKPINLSSHQLEKAIVLWVRERMPLELLTSRRDEKELQRVRAACERPELCRLTGLLAHLTYWRTIGASRGPGQSRLTSQAMQGLESNARDIWFAFEDEHRSNPLGVSLILPCAMLTVKVGMLHCFEEQYPKTLRDVQLLQKLIDRINTLVMRLLDPDNVFARFGKLDGSGDANSLTRKLEHLQNPRGPATHGKRFVGKSRALSQHVQSVLKSGTDALATPPELRSHSLASPRSLPPLRSARV